MRKIINVVFCAIVIGGFAAIPNYAGEIEATVSVNYEQIPIDQREDILTMKEDVEQYLNSMRYTDSEWEGEPIKVDITIYIMSRTGNSYAARLFLISGRDLYNQEGSSVAVRVFDDQWYFPYSRNAVLTHQRNFYDRFTGLLDFYMFIVVGQDLDTYGELDGTAMYERARQVWQNGAAEQAAGFDAYSEPGEMTRYNLVSEFTNQRFEPFRRLIFSYYVDGLDQMADDPEAALEALNRVLDGMVLFKKHKLTTSSVFLQFFFDSKHQELGDLFKEYYNRGEVLLKLQYLDPGHASGYQEALE